MRVSLTKQGLGGRTSTMGNPLLGKIWHAGWPEHSGKLVSGPITGPPVTSGLYGKRLDRAILQSKRTPNGRSSVGPALRQTERRPRPV